MGIAGGKDSAGNGIEIEMSMLSSGNDNENMGNVGNAGRLSDRLGSGIAKFRFRSSSGRLRLIVGSAGIGRLNDRLGSRIENGSANLQRDTRYSNTQTAIMVRSDGKSSPPAAYV